MASEEFRLFISDTLEILCRKMHMPQDTFVLSESGMEIVAPQGDGSAMLVRAVGSELNHLARAVFSRSELTEHWAFDAGHRPLTASQFASELHLSVSHSLLDRYCECYGISTRLLDNLCIEHYEGEAQTGRLLFLTVESSVSAFLDAAKADVIFSLQNERYIPFNDQYVRKLVKMLVAAKGNCLLFLREKSRLQDSYQLVGAVSGKECFPLAFDLREGRWELWFDGVHFFESFSGYVRAVADVIGNAVKELKEEFGAAAECFRVLLDALFKQARGAAVVIADLDSFPYVRKRIEELVCAGRSFAITPIPVVGADVPRAQVFTSLGGVDGALVLDAGKNAITNFGTIVDGVVSFGNGGLVAGIAGAGARHNSIQTFLANLVTYYEQNASENGIFKIAAVIFSEDGMVKVITGSSLREEQTKIHRDH